MQLVVDSDVLAIIQRSGQLQELQVLGRLPVIVTDVVWDELTIGTSKPVPPRVSAEMDAALVAIAGAKTPLLPETPEAASFLRLHEVAATEDAGEHSVIAYAFHHHDTVAVLHDRVALHRGVEELKGRVLSLHGFLGRLREEHGLSSVVADAISVDYCKKYKPQRAPLWW